MQPSQREQFEYEKELKDRQVEYRQSLYITNLVFRVILLIFHIVSIALQSGSTIGISNLVGSSSGGLSGLQIAFISFHSYSLFYTTLSIIFDILNLIPPTKKALDNQVGLRKFHKIYTLITDYLLWIIFLVIGSMTFVDGILFILFPTYSQISGAAGLTLGVSLLLLIEAIIFSARTCCCP